MASTRNLEVDTLVAKSNPEKEMSTNKQSDLNVGRRRRWRGRRIHPVRPRRARGTVDTVRAGSPAAGGEGVAWGPCGRSDKRSGEGRPVVVDGVGVGGVARGDPGVQFNRHF